MVLIQAYLIGMEGLIEFLLYEDPLSVEQKRLIVTKMGFGFGLVWFGVPLRVNGKKKKKKVNGKILLTPAPHFVPSAVLFVFVFACRHTTNIKSKENIEKKNLKLPAFQCLIE